MLTEAEAIEKLAKLIDSKRLQHSLAVKETALELWQKYKQIEIDKNKVKWAALLHDCAKGIGKDNLLRKAKDFGIVINGVYREVPELLHAPVGAEIAKREFGIDDYDILQAISYHTIGAPEMTTLDKIIFLADYIEPNRDCKKINQLRDKVEQITLDEAVRIACENTIIYTLKQKKIIHPQTIRTRNALI